MRVDEEPLLERDREHAALNELAGRALAGEGRLALIEGPAGIGKTRLVRAAQELAAATGMRCLSARGSEMERAFPFGVVRQLFEPPAREAEAGELDELFAGPAGLATHLLTGGGQSHAPDAGGLFAVYHGLYWLTANLSASRPLALFVDDLHWCDPPSLGALEYLGRRLEGLPVLLVLASRAHEPGFERSTLDALAREPSTVVVAPRALSESGTAELLRARLGPGASDAFCHACQRATDGNPLLVAELATALADEGVTGRPDEVARVEEVGPEAVARSVRLRLARLPEAARSFARAASVLGDGALLEDVAAMAALQPSEAARVAGALGEVELLRVQETIAFTHPVVRAAVYASLGPFGQREAHARAVKLLAEAGRSPERIAAHILQCPPTGDANAVEILRASARRSIADGAVDLAAAYLSRALDEPPEQGKRSDVLFELGAAEQLLNGPRAAEHLREALALAADPSGRAAIAIALGRALYMAGRMLEAKDVFEETLGDPALDAGLARSVEAGLVVLGLFEPSLVEGVRDRLRGFNADTGLDDLNSLMLLSYAAYDEARSGGERETAVAQALRVLEGRAILDEDSQGSWAALASILWAADRFDDAQRLAEDVARIGDESGSVFLAASGLVLAANIHHRRGALSDAEAYVSSAVETADAHGFVTISNWAAALWAIVLVDRGDGAAAWDVLRRFGLDGALPDTVHLYEARLARGLAQVARGQVRDGVDALREVGQLWDAIGARNPDMAPWRAHLAEALLLLGEVDEARSLASEQVTLAQAWGAHRPLARALRVHGLSLGGDQGQAVLRESVEIARRSPSRLELALSLVELGAALRRSNRRTAARELLEEGISLAHRCSARGLEERALQELLATGARPRRSPASGRDALTPSELRVTELAAAGQTNREIAQRLFVTQKTVEAHLARAFRKLDVDSRTQLASALSK